MPNRPDVQVVKSFGAGKDSMDLNVHHPAYDETYEYRFKSRTIYDGSETIKKEENAEFFLYQEANEHDSDYELRLKRSTIDPWINKIVTARQALLFGNQHIRDLDARLEAFIDNVDMKDTSAEEFFFQASEVSQIDGIDWVKVIMPPPILFVDEEGNELTDENGNPIRPTGADDAEFNRRPYFKIVSGFNVIDWEFDEFGELKWVVEYKPIYVRKMDEATEWGWPLEIKDQWEIWTKNQWFVYEESKTSKDAKKEFIIVEQGAHPLGEVPYVPFYGIKKEENAGLPIAYSVLDHIILIFNKDSDLDWYERLSAHPIPYTIGGHRPQKLDASKGFHLMTSAEVPSGSVGYLETSGSGFTSLRESVQDLRFRIMSTMLSQAKKDSAQVQSAEGQREDRKIFMTSLKSTSYTIEHSEQRCWILMYKWITEGARVDDMSKNSIAFVEYNKDFDDSMIDDVMIKTLSELVVKNQLPLRRFVENLIEGEILPAETDIDEFMDELEQDVIRNSGLMPPNDEFAATDDDE